ncbi:hypothetical protein M3P05_10115 [Sansalvadorimonas sp. 2012CJ34-2]|uniref:Uncharacterized protein n=1 Tax=Parendozoicomonas callyspongiae TaxID=2942213 RepID=A0ABT0PG92_9GAMM|nr:hypothetical protein [Sansalvadorimonas sp. 2012CJ34-2]MCL6270276.1 hypothetical protein [Sansalvadorimonas sp. 2012CJ34-2]
MNRSKPSSQDVLKEKRIKIDQLIQLVRKQADRHVDLAHGQCHWGHVGDLNHMIEHLEYALGIERA